MRFIEHIFSLFSSQKSAKLAKERLQIIVTHDRRKRRYLPLLQQELLDVVRKYASIDDDDIKIHLEKQGNYEVLEMNIALPK
ncbi:cell division topological specificity factor MinE [Candidatus Marithrix sp. Canyon 246]|uniref:cell division topological specificity factor MinE n=1 Tax=Candidatus Marithrix sp. Canyon 246 TaxID=1827136 RepID=UPI000849F265|nr:cell division topological specificity factor MinE [Candidatus Marithrix sp. Canyon 246]